jgi:hypothetical protein
MHFFHCPNEPDAKVVVLSYRVGSEMFLTAHKHAFVDGARKQIPNAEETPEDAKFIEQCKAEVAEQLRAEGNTVR